MTLALIAASNCLLAFVILGRAVTPAWLAGWFAALYGVHLCNLALFSIPETYSLSTLAVLVYLSAAIGVARPITRRRLALLAALTGLAALFNPPLLSLSVIHLVLIIRDWPARSAVAMGVSSVLFAVAMFVTVNVIIFGPEFHTNFAVDNERYGAMANLTDPVAVGTVLAGFYLYSVITPLPYLTHDLPLASAAGYLASASGVLLLAAYVAFLAFTLSRCLQDRRPSTVGLLAWLVVITAFYIYFNPLGVMLYAVQVLLVPLFLIATEFARTPASIRVKYGALALFSVLMLLHNLRAVYAPVVVLPRS